MAVYRHCRGIDQDGNVMKCLIVNVSLMMKDGLDNLIFVGFTIPMVTSTIRQMKHCALECTTPIPGQCNHK